MFVSFRFTQKLPITDVGPPLILTSCENLSLLPGILNNHTLAYVTPAFHVKFGERE